jgi:hypothetical protein
MRIASRVSHATGDGGSLSIVARVQHVRRRGQSQKAGSSRPLTPGSMARREPASGCSATRPSRDLRGGGDVQAIEVLAAEGTGCRVRDGQLDTCVYFAVGGATDHAAAAEPGVPDISLGVDGRPVGLAGRRVRGNEGPAVRRVSGFGVQVQDFERARWSVGEIKAIWSPRRTGARRSVPTRKRISACWSAWARTRMSEPCWCWAPTEIRRSGRVGHRRTVRAAGRGAHAGRRPRGFDGTHGEGDPTLRKARP